MRVYDVIISAVIGILIAVCLIFLYEERLRYLLNRRTKFNSYKAGRYWYDHKLRNGTKILKHTGIKSPGEAEVP